MSVYLFCHVCLEREVTSGCGMLCREENVANDCHYGRVTSMIDHVIYVIFLVLARTAILCAALPRADAANGHDYSVANIFHGQVHHSRHRTPAQTFLDSNTIDSWLELNPYCRDLIVNEQLKHYIMAVPLRVQHRKSKIVSFPSSQC